MSLTMSSCVCLLFLFSATATTEIYTLSLHDALPIYRCRRAGVLDRAVRRAQRRSAGDHLRHDRAVGADCRRSLLLRSASRSEEHTSELQSRLHLVCRLLLEKKKKKNNNTPIIHKTLV